MKDREATAKEFHKNGCNCAQAVAMAYADVIGMDEERVAALMSPFGKGMGGMCEVCGAVTGMFMVFGAANGDSGVGCKEMRPGIYKKTRELAAEFKEKYGSIICAELLKQQKNAGDSPEEGQSRQTCNGYVGYAAAIVQKYVD